MAQSPAQSVHLGIGDRIPPDVVGVQVDPVLRLLLRLRAFRGAAHDELARLHPAQLHLGLLPPDMWRRLGHGQELDQALGPGDDEAACGPAHGAQAGRLRCGGLCFCLRPLLFVCTLATQGSREASRTALPCFFPSLPRLALRLLNSLLSPRYSLATGLTGSASLEVNSPEGSPVQTAGSLHLSRSHRVGRLSMEVLKVPDCNTISISSRFSHGYFHRPILYHSLNLPIQTDSIEYTVNWCTIGQTSPLSLRTSS